MMLHILRTSLNQGWTVFCVIAPLGAVGYGLIEGNSLLYSDDPYIIGTFFGCVSGVVAAIQRGVETVTKKRRWAHISGGGILTIWSVALISASFMPGEGTDFGRFFGIGSAVTGVLAWPLYLRSFPLRLQVCLSVVGAGYLLLWFIIAGRVLMP